MLYRCPRPVFVLALLVCATAPVAAEDLPRAKPAEVGLSAERLAEIDTVVQRRIESKAVAGAVTLVARHGKVAYFKAFGAFKQDSIFRIYSMSKPITVVAALLLVDEGKLGLDDPVSKHLPALAALKVSPDGKPAKPMTIRHLMMHTAGLTYGFFGNTPVDQAYRREKLLDRSGSLETMVAKLAKIPLVFQPGERWRYSVSLDVLGRVIEVVAKKPFDVFLKERLFDPLGMVDTAFFVPEAKLPRFVANYGMRGEVIDDPKTSEYRTKPVQASGGGGLVSTARDYARFALMLAQGGVWKGKRVLKADSVKAMATNGLPEKLVPIRFGPVPLIGQGFGLGVSVRVAAAGKGRRLDEWGWGGAASTTFVISPRDDLVVINMTQRMPMWSVLRNEIRTVVYAAVESKQPAGASSSPPR